MSTLLDVTDVCAGYGAAQVLFDVTLTVNAQETVALLGSNGAGKTTLNNVLSGVVSSRSGRVHFDSVDLTSLGARARVQAGLIHVPEGRKVFPNMSVEENLLLGAYARARERRSSNLARVFETFPRLLERRKQSAGTLSGGEQQMLAIGRGLMAEPKLLILDEPSLGLSPKLVEELFTLIGELQKQGLAILLVEQNVAQSLEVAKRAYVMEQGSIRFEGTPHDLLSNDDVRRAYLGA